MKYNDSRIKGTERRREMKLQHVRRQIVLSFYNCALNNVRGHGNKGQSHAFLTITMDGRLLTVKCSMITWNGRSYIGRVWHSFTNSFLSCCELFLSNTFSCKTVHGEAPFLCSHKRMKRCRAGKEVAFHSSPIAQIVGEVILRNSFFQNSSASSRKLPTKCQIGP